MRMNQLALWHRAKSEYAYAYDKKTLHILLRAQKNDINGVHLIYGDPFFWYKKGDGPSVWKKEVLPMLKRYSNEDFDYYFIAIQPTTLRTKYAFIMQDDDTHYLYGSQGFREITSGEHQNDTHDLSEFFNFPYLHQEDLHQTPDWVKDTIWYQIFPDRFYGYPNTSQLSWGKLPVHNHEFYGGNLHGVTQKLHYLKDLGITGIYFTPIFQAPSAHKYDTTDYFKIDPQFGTNDDFKELVDQAHKHGIKIMLDGVFNHCGFDHPFFQDVIKHGENSIYKDCFYIEQFPVINFPLNEKGKPQYRGQIKLNYQTFAFTPYMPKWQTSHPVVEKHLLDVVTYWIENYDIDGWRLDVSNEISHDFLRKIKQASRKTKHNTFILGENWDSSYPWLHGDQLDSVMNYDLAYPLWMFLDHQIDQKNFINRVSTYLATTPKNVMENMFNLVGSHDTIRIKRRLKDDSRRVKLAYLWMFLSSGAPNIYYGDEMGMTGEHDPDNRRCMLWDEKDQDQDFYRFVKRLISLRKQYPVMSTPDYHFIESSMLTFEKRDAESTLLIFINNADEQSIRINHALHGTYLDLINDKKMHICDTMTMKAYDFLLLLKEDK